MNKDLLSYCEKEIQDLMDKKLIRKSKSPWSCSAFYVQKQAELERGTPRTTREEEGFSSGNPKNVKLTGVRSYTNVARPFYSEENESTQESQ